MNNKGKTLLIELTQQCNLNCKYCFYRDYGRAKEEIDLFKLQEIISENEDISEIFFTGGECTIAKAFLQIIEEASKKAKVTIFTNGIKLKDITFLKQIDGFISQYIVTYDDYKNEYFCRDNVEFTEKGIQNVLKISPDKLVVKICINKYNIDNLENIIKHIYQLGVKKISINMIHNINNSSNNFELEKNDIIKAFDILDEYKEICHINYYDDVKTFFKQDMNLLNKKCKAGKSFFFYDCYGNKKKCPGDCKKKNCKVTKECISLFEMF